MKAVILAAGVGRRLKPLTQNLAKGLIEIGGRALLEHSLEALQENGIKEAIIVIGHQGDSIKKKLGNKYAGIELDYIENKRYYETGSMYSLSQINGLVDEDILLLESDLLYDKKALKVLLESEPKNAILVADLSGSGDEVYICTDARNRVTYLGKSVHIDKDIFGELVGISKLTRAFLSKLFEKAEQDYRENELNRLYEECIFATSRLGCSLYAVLYKGLHWIEIDNKADLKRAKEKIYPKIKAIRDRKVM